MSEAHSQANFNPGKLTVDVADLCKQVADLQAIVTGKEGFKVSEIVEALDALGRVVGDFLPRVANIETMIAPLVPLIPVLEKQFSGESAGEGHTIATGVVIPAEEIGTFSDTPVAIESRDPPASDAVQQQPVPDNA